MLTGLKYSAVSEMVEALMMINQRKVAYKSASQKSQVSELASSWRMHTWTQGLVRILKLADESFVG